MPEDVEQFDASLAELARERDATSASQGRWDAEATPRCCLGLFAAADILGNRLVYGGPYRLYLERVDVATLRR